MNSLIFIALAFMLLMIIFYLAEALTRFTKR